MEAVTRSSNNIADVNMKRMIIVISAKMHGTMRLGL